MAKTPVLERATTLARHLGFGTALLLAAAIPSGPVRADALKQTLSGLLYGIADSGFHPFFPYQRIGSFEWDWHWNSDPGTTQAISLSPDGGRYVPVPTASAQYYVNLTMQFAPFVRDGANNPIASPYCGGSESSGPSSCTYSFTQGTGKPLSFLGPNPAAIGFAVLNGTAANGDPDAFEMVAWGRVGGADHAVFLAFLDPAGGCLGSRDLQPLLNRVSSERDCLVRPGGGGNGWDIGLLGLGGNTVGLGLDAQVTYVGQVPEPATLTIFAAALLSLGAVSRRPRRS